MRTRVRLHASADRQTPMRPVYRASVWVGHERAADGALVVHDVLLDFDGEVLPGEEVTATLQPVAPDLWPDQRMGTRLDLWEGRVNGWIEIIEPVVHSG